MKRLISVLTNILLVLISTAAMLVLCELVFQHILFGKWKGAEPLREPAAYADIYNDKHAPVFSQEYWILYYLFDKQYKPPAHPHPLFGWIGNFDPVTLIHRDASRVQGRRPVLLFGDSFSICVGAKCFEEILNEDSTFASKYYLLNYGVGGYGVDQIYLLAKEVIPLYDDPLVIFGLMTRDMDRNILAFRTGQKPYFEIQNNQLILKGKPIEPNVAYFVEHNMPDITSYLYRYFRNSLQLYLPEYDERTINTVNHIKKLNEMILSDAVDFLRQDSVDFRFLVFSALYLGHREWRNLVVREFLESRDVPYIWAKDLIENDSNYFDVSAGFYENGTHGHPTTYQNELICHEIKRCLFDSTYASRVDSINSAYFKKIRHEFDSENPSQFEMLIRKDKEWMRSIKEKAKDRGISVDSMVSLDATWLKLMDEKARKKGISMDSMIRLEAEYMLKESLNK